MGSNRYSKNMLVGSAIAAVLVAASRLYLTKEAGRWTAIVALIIFFVGVTILPPLIRMTRKPANAESSPSNETCDNTKGK